MTLFRLGWFRSSAGLDLPFKIECDDLTPEDWECLAYMTACWAGPFHEVIGVPTGGLRLEHALRQYIEVAVEGAIVVGRPVVLIVDDVFTTGSNMERARQEAMLRYPEDAFIIRGAVAFATVLAGTPCPDWITPICRVGLTR